jgi:hypothetical protein
MDLSEAVRLSGRLQVEVFRHGALVERWAEENMIVSSARAALAALIGGTGAGKTIARIGFGTNGLGPSPDDSAMTNSYVKLIGGVAYPAQGQVRFSWSLAESEANGKIIREFGLLCSDGALFSRKVRGVIEKESDISLSGTWTITF